MTMFGHKAQRWRVPETVIMAELAEERRFYKARQATRPTCPKATHIAGYVPPKGSVVRMFYGNVINPVKGIGT